MSKKLLALSAESARYDDRVGSRVDEFERSNDSSSPARFQSKSRACQVFCMQSLIIPGAGWGSLADKRNASSTPCVVVLPGA